MVEYDEQFSLTYRLMWHTNVDCVETKKRKIQQQQRTRTYVYEGNFIRDSHIFLVCI